jgi:hypothetical protein
MPGRAGTARRCGPASKASGVTGVNQWLKPLDRWITERADATGQPLSDGAEAAAGLLLPERFSRRRPQPGYRSGYDQG